MARGLELMQGTLDMLVLKSLLGGARHGYAVTRWVRETTSGRLDIEEGALYTALHRMERRGWIRAEWGLSETNRRAKYYSLKPEGREQLATQARRWAAYAEAVFMVLRAEEAVV
jgi:PadR family transcriptional regulator, regulatory protein PadR